MNGEEFGWPKLLKLKYRKEEEIIQLFCRIGSLQEIRFPLINLMNFKEAEKNTAESWKMNWNLMKDKEFGSFKLLKLKYRKREEIFQLFCRIGSSQEIRSPLFNLMSFQKARKSTAESYRMHTNLMNYNEFRSFKFLKLNYRTGDQIIQPFRRNPCSQEIRSNLFNLNKFQKP